MKEKVILKSANPSVYPDLAIECKVITNSEIGQYVKNIPDERKFSAYKSVKVRAREGIKGEVIKTDIKTIVDGREYILKEEEGIVKERSCTKKLIVAGNIEEYPSTNLDYVITNVSSTSNEEYVCKYDQFQKTYTIGADGYYYPVYEAREFAQVDENIMFETAWGSYVYCLKGSYIVTYNQETNDYNAIEKDAFERTYTKEEGISKKLKRN